MASFIGAAGLRLTLMSGSVCLSSSSPPALTLTLSTSPTPTSLPYPPLYFCVVVCNLVLPNARRGCGGKHSISKEFFNKKSTRTFFSSLFTKQKASTHLEEYRQTKPQRASQDGVTDRGKTNLNQRKKTKPQEKKERTTTQRIRKKPFYSWRRRTPRYSSSQTHAAVMLPQKNNSEAKKYTGFSLSLSLSSLSLFSPFPPYSTSFRPPHTH